MVCRNLVKYLIAVESPQLHGSRFHFPFGADFLGASGLAQRTLWICLWGGDISSTLCFLTLPFQGPYLFGDMLDTALKKVSERQRKISPIPPPSQVEENKLSPSSGANTSERKSDWKVTGPFVHNGVATLWKTNSHVSKIVFLACSTILLDM